MATAGGHLLSGTAAVIKVNDSSDQPRVLVHAVHVQIHATDILFPLVVSMQDVLLGPRL